MHPTEQARTHHVFEFIAFGDDADDAYQQIRSTIGDGFALRRVDVPDGIAHGDFMDLVRAEQQLADPFARIPNRQERLIDHEHQLAHYNADVVDAVIVAANYDAADRVCCYVEMTGDVATLERSTQGIDSAARVFVFFGAHETRLS